MKKIYVSENRVLLNLLKSALETNGIQSFIKNEFPPAAGEITPIIAWPEIWISNNDDEPKAMKIIHEVLQSQSTINEAWACPDCGEKLDGQFKICWKCGHQRKIK